MKKLAVITGGSEGIGRALVMRFAAAGFDVATCARRAAGLTALQATVADLHSDAQLHLLPTDMGEKQQVLAFADFVGSLGAVPEVLVHNAGYFEPGMVSEQADEVLEQMMQINLMGAYYLTKKLLPAMRAQPRGHIFMINSIASLMAYPNGGAYSITKHALHGLARALRAELRESQIRVTSVLPGATRTRSWDGVDLPEERFMTPEDIADAVFGAYALSERTVVEEILLRPQLGDI